MKKTLRHITVYLLASTMLLATTGLSVHHLYCICKGEMVTALFRPAEPCELAEKANPGKSCCKGSTCGTDEQHEKHNCADCTSEFVKLDAKYLLPTFFDLKPAVLAVPQTAHFPLFDLVVFTKNAPHWEHDLPPPPAGKQLLPWVQSFLC